MKNLLVLTALSVISTMAFLSPGAEASTHSCFVDPAGQRLEVSQVKLYVDSSVPTEMIPAIEVAIAELSEFKGSQIFRLSGSVTGGAKMDGVNTISFSSNFSDEEASKRIRTTAYWYGSRIAEIDLTVNIKSFEVDAHALKEAVKHQLVRFTCD